MVAKLSEESAIAFLTWCNFAPLEKYSNVATPWLVKCNSCKTVKNVIEEFNTLNLTIDKDEVLSIYDLFNNYFKKETHDDPKNLYYCENCKCNTVSEHKTTLWKLPKKIIVNLVKIVF